MFFFPQILVMFRELELQKVESGFVRRASPRDFPLPPRGPDSSQVPETWQDNETFYKTVFFLCTPSPNANA